MLRDYLGKVEKDYKRGIATEHSYRGTLKDLLETLNSAITATNEPKRIQCGAPDYVIERSRGTNTFTIGYVEAKDAGMNLDEIERDSRLSEPKTREGKQLKRYLHALDNLVFTNYLEFRWYLHGEKRATATLSTPQSEKRLPFDKDRAHDVAQLLQSFLGQSAEPVRNPPELAKRMARLAHMIRDIIVEAFEQKAASNELKDLYSAFKEVLLPELTGPEFADMFAQTLAYGLFAARYNHKGAKAFNRNDAAKEIPRTNPFLRRLFGTIAGPDLDDEPFAGFVDDLAQVLAVTDMEAVLADFGKHTRQEDPIVHFYETFLAQYDPKMRELRGVYYTPEPVVSYIVRSVDALLRTHFDCPDGLGDDSTVSYTYVDDQGETQTVTSPRVLLLDPACGTGTFLYYVIEHIRESYRQTGNAGMWSGYVREQLLPRLFGFELLMAPYAMAHLKLGMQLAAVDLPPSERATWAYDLTFRGMRQSLMQSFDDIYVLDLHGNSKKKEHSPDGTKDENVFDIQQGVAIGIFVKRPQIKKQKAIIHHSNLWGVREIYEKTPSALNLIGGKYNWLAENSLNTTEWTTFEPLSPFYLFVPQNVDLEAEYSKLWKLSDLTLLNSVGIATSRDDLTIHYAPEMLMASVKNFAKLPIEQAREEFNLGNDTRDWQVHLAQADINHQPISTEHIKKILYRPFDFRYTYYTGKTRGFISMPRYELIKHMLSRNLALYVGRQGQVIGSDAWDLIFSGELMEDYNLYRRGNNACFPLYLYSDPNKQSLFDMNESSDTGSNRRPNLSPAFITDISNKLNMQFISDGPGDLHTTFGPEDIFHYMYAVFHSPAYRERYAEFLKIDFPRLPLTSHVELFRVLCGLGERLVGLHLMEKYGQAVPNFPEPGNDTIEKVEYMLSADRPETGRVYINKTQYFEGVAPDVWEFHVGGYQVCHKWLKDRKGRVLTNSDKRHYQRIVAALAETITLMEAVDAAIDERGGWPIG